MIEVKLNHIGCEFSDLEIGECFTKDGSTIFIKTSNDTAIESMIPTGRFCGDIEFAEDQLVVRVRLTAIHGETK